MTARPALALALLALLVAPAGVARAQAGGAPASGGAREAAPAGPAAPALPGGPGARAIWAGASPSDDDILTGSLAGGDGRALRHLPNNLQGYRLVGEVGASEWPVYLTEAQAARPSRFRVGYLSAVSVMPEASFVTVAVNDRVIGRAPLRAPHAVREVEFDLPPGLARSGFNAVRVAVEQRHRVDCSVEATHELWTQVDPSRTGLVLPAGDPGASEVADLAALPPDAQGALPVRLVLPPRTGAGAIERAMRAAALVALNGRFEQPVVDVGPLADGEHGVNVAVGPRDDLARIPGLEALAGGLGPQVSVLPAGAGRRATVVVTGAGDAEVAAALEQLATPPAPKGSPAGLRAASAFPGRRVEGGSRVPLSDLGLVSQEFSGRFFRAAFNLVMPPDFYPADTGKVILELAGGYAPGLTQEARVVVAVNGRNAISSKLPKAGGDAFRRNELPLPLGLLRPGLNRVEIQAMVPSGEDAACDTLGAVAARKRFLFLASSAITIPPIARIARLPDLAVTTTGGFPYAGGRPAALFLPQPDKDTIGAAATLAARLAVAAGRPIDFRIVLAPPPAGSGPVLVVAPARALDPATLSAAGVDPTALRRAWEERAAAPPPSTDEAMSIFEAAARNRQVLQRNFPAACHMPRPARRAAGAPAPAPAPAAPGPAEAPADLYAEWDQAARARTRWISAAGDAAGGAFGWSRERAGRAAAWLAARFEAPPERLEVAERASLVIAQTAPGSDGDDVWTLVTAPTAALLREAVACLVDPRVWRQVEGRAGALDAAEAQVSSLVARAPRFVATQPFGLGNARLILASWLSLHEAWFVGIVSALALALAGSTTLLLRHVGRTDG